MQSRNSCGLLQTDTLNLSNVYLEFDKNNGGLVNYHQSDDAYRMTAAANSIYRFNERIVFGGGIDYSYFKGQDMSGSALLNPYANAYDICEFTDQFKGEKRLEQYHILAELGWNVHKGLILGASFDFNSANYSKMKDLRHSNTWSDLNFDLTAAYRFSDIFTFGAAYHYKKSLEGIYFYRYSPTEKHYDMLISYGPFWGKRKAFDRNEGQISASRTPMYNSSNGVSMQFDVKPEGCWSFFIEGEFDYRKGSYGLKSPSTIQYNSNDGYNYGFSFTHLVQADDARHLISFKLANNTTNNYESVYKIATSSSGMSSVTYFDPVNVGRASFSSYTLAYRADWKIQENLPLWTADFSTEFFQRDKKGTLYPYYRNESLLFYHVNAGLCRKFIFRDNMFTGGLAIRYIGKIKDKCIDGSHIPNPTQNKPRESELMRGRELEYLSSSQLFLNPTFRYSRRMKKMTAYADLSYSYRKALEEIEFLTGDDSHIISFSIGLIL